MASESIATPLVKAQEDEPVSVIVKIAEIAVANKKEINGKYDRAMLAISKIVSKGVETDEDDKLANDMIVKCNSTVTAMQELRKAYTGPINDYLKVQIEPENKLKLEIAKVVGMRNSRAMRNAEKARLQNAQIDKEKNYKLYEASVKKAMQESVELGIHSKLEELRAWLAKAFAMMTKANIANVESQMRGIKPRLKEDYYISLFQVDYDNLSMDQAQFDELVGRAKGYWTYEKINDGYVDMFNKEMNAWLERLPTRIKELDIIDNGGEEAARLRDIVAQREAKEAAEAQKQAEAKKLAISQAAGEAEQKAVYDAEFEAQAQTQRTADLPSGTRSSYYFILNNEVEKDLMKLSKVLGSLIINMIGEMKWTEVFEHDQQGLVKRDKHGNAIYVDGIKFWLDRAAKLKYVPQIEGLKQIHITSTVAKA